MRTVMETTRQSACIKNHGTEGAVAVAEQKTQCHATAATGEDGGGQGGGGGRGGVRAAQSAMLWLPR